MPRRAGDSQFYLVTPMQNGMTRAECYKPDCHWWQDFSEHEEADRAMRDHKKIHRKPSRKRRWDHEITR